MILVKPMTQTSKKIEICSTLVTNYEQHTKITDREQVLKILHTKNKAFGLLFMNKNSCNIYSNYFIFIYLGAGVKPFDAFMCFSISS
jgi:hypothetical protein